MMTGQNISECMLVARAHPDLNHGTADLQSAALTTELCTQVGVQRKAVQSSHAPSAVRHVLALACACRDSPP